MRNFSEKFLKNYEEVFKYLKTLKRSIIFSVSVFFFFTIIGYFFTSVELSESIMKYFQEIVLKTQGYSAIEMVLFLISNNSIATFLSVFMGLFFGFFPLFSAMSNGYILGFVASYSVEKSGFLSLLAILPHGVFELPAIFISLAMGLRLGKSTINLIFSKEKVNMKKELRSAFLAYALVVLPLLAIAGIIEGILISLI